MPRKDGQCTVLIDMWGISMGDAPNQVEEWTFGLAALRNYCWNVNLGDTSVSIAKALS